MLSSHKIRSRQEFDHVILLDWVQSSSELIQTDSILEPEEYIRLADQLVIGIRVGFINAYGSKIARPRLNFRDF